MTRSNQMRRSDVATAAALLVLGILLCLLGAGLLAQWRESAARHQDTSVDFLLAAAAAAAGACLVLWWTVSVLAAAASLVLERLGQRRAAAAARRFSPAFMRRAVVAAVSVQLLAGVAAHAAAPAAGPEWMPTQTLSSSAPSSQAAPASDATTGQDDSPPVAGLPATPPLTKEPPATEGAVPASSPSASPAGTTHPGWQPAPPVVDPGLLAAGDNRETRGAHSTGRTEAITVLAGDTLWDIVATHLGPGASDVVIALEWPRWYAANRVLIGGNPDVLLPGQILQAPAAP